MNDARSFFLQGKNVADSVDLCFYPKGEEA